MTNKKILIILGTLLVVFLLVLFWPVFRKDENGEPIKERKLMRPEAEFIMKTPKEIEWKIDEEKEYKKTKAMIVQGKNWSEDDKAKIRNVLIGGAMPVGQFFKIYDTADRYEFSRNIETADEIEEGDLDDMTIKGLLENMMEQLQEVNNGIGMGSVEIRYKEFLYPWWVSATRDKFDALELRANYVFEGVPVAMFNGHPIIANYFTNGKLAKIQGQIPFEKVVKSEEKELISLDSLKKVRAEDIKIWEINGGQEYELSGEDVELEKVEIYDYNLGYIYDFKSKVVWPFYFLNGNSQLATGPAKVILITPATRE